MPSELVTAAQILAGSGAVAWVADKLLGPSAEALGQQVKVYASVRVTEIFARVAEKRDQEDIGQLPPGFALVALQRASVSEDDSQITEMWANLLLAASDDYTSRHMVFADILSQIGPSEAQLLSTITGKAGDYRLSNIGNIEINFRSGLDWLGIGGELSRPQANDLLEPIREVFERLPAAFERVEICLRGNPSEKCGLTVYENVVSALILERQNVLKGEVLTYNTRSHGEPTVTVRIYVPTVLGLEFLSACEGQ